MNYPEEIMHDVAWSFVGMQYRSQKQFIEAVNDYNEKLGTTGRGILMLPQFNAKR